MKLIPITSIVIKPTRQRRTFDEAAIVELANSIEKHGLFHPPVLRGENDALVLVAGERRLRAISDMHELGRKFTFDGIEVPRGLVPYSELGELDALSAEEAELEENIRRVDLSWQERAEADARLLDLRTKQAAQRGDTPPTAADIAREVYDLPESTPSGALGEYQQSVRRNVILAKHLDDPEVKAAKSPKEAYKILKKREEVARNVELAASVGATFSSQSHRLEQADFFQWITTEKPEQFDIILTDPPYGMGADEFGDSGVGSSAAAHFYKDDYDTWSRIMAIFPDATFRLAKPDAHAYVFCDIDRFHELRERMTKAGWKVHRTPLIWHNPDGFRAPWPEQGPQRKYELILYAVKGGLKTTTLQGDVIECRKDQALGHPAQKPVVLLTNLLKRSARPGMSVLDLFGGSGGTVEAAHELKLPCTMIEGDANAYGIAVKRVKALSAFDQGLF